MNTDLVKTIRAEVSRLDPQLAHSDPEFAAACICLLLFCADFPDSWDDIQTAAAQLLDLDRDRVGQLITNLRAGGALVEDAPGSFQPGIATALEGQDSGLTLCCFLVPVAMGHMRYFPEKDAFSLTAVGRSYVEQRLLPDTDHQP